MPVKTQYRTVGVLRSMHKGMEIFFLMQQLLVFFSKAKPSEKGSYGIKMRFFTDSLHGPVTFFKVFSKTDRLPIPFYIMRAKVLEE